MRETTGLIIATLLLTLGSGGCQASEASASGAEKDTPKAAHPQSAAKAEIQDAAGRTLGFAEFETRGGAVRMSLTVTNLPPGLHGLHIHETGVCTGPGFEDAGGHFNPTGKGHGLADEHVDGSHAGDMPNLVADGTGSAVALHILNHATLEPGAPLGSKSLLREGGTAVVIHAKADDGRTNPSGAAGGRIACGVISPASSTP